MERANITFCDFRSVCRTCLCSCNDVVSFNVNNAFILDTTVIEILFRGSPLQMIENDALPKQLCQDCFSDLRNCCEFVDKFQRSEQAVMALLSQREMKINEEDNTRLDEIEQEKIEVSYAKTKCVSPKSEKLHSCLKKVKKVHKCNECGKHFSVRKTLDMHYKAKHLHEKPFNCNYCERSFAYKTNQVTHERIHTGVKPYSCGFCEKGFAKRTDCVVHERTHTGEKRYKCGFCDKVFSKKESQTSHERTHTGEKPYKCGFCDKSFVNKGSQICHERTHTGEKPYRCGFCEKSFSHSATRIAHERLHTGEKPYKCGFCERNFTTKGQQAIHEKTHGLCSEGAPGCS